MTIARRQSFMGALYRAAASLAAASLAAAVLLVACSSSDDVVASVDETALGGLPQPGGAPALTIVQSVGDPTAAPGVPAPAGTAVPPPVAGSASAGIGRPPPPHELALGEALYVRGTPKSPPLAGAERWPLDAPLRQFFPPAPEQRLVVILVPTSPREPLRELAARHGLGEATAMVQVLVEDDVGDQFELVLSEDLALAVEPLPADD